MLTGDVSGYVVETAEKSKFGSLDSFDKYIKENKTKNELWKMAEPKMTNPINKSQCYTGHTLNESLKKTNISALAHYTDLNDEQVEFLAMRPGFGKFIVGVNLKPINAMEGNLYIEEWKYDPDLLTKTKFVDPLSLYLSFRESKNERVEMALERLLKQICQTCFEILTCQSVIMSVFL